MSNTKKTVIALLVALFILWRGSIIVIQFIPYDLDEVPTVVYHVCGIEYSRVSLRHDGKTWYCSRIPYAPPEYWFERQLRENEQQP